MRKEQVANAHEEKLGHALVKARLLTDNQLKTAQDYQRSLGGSLADVAVKLGFLRPQVISQFLSDTEHAPPTSPAEPPASGKERPDAAGAPKRSAKVSPPDTAVLMTDAESEAPTQFPEPQEEKPSTAHGLAQIDPVLRALLDRLVEKSVLSQKDLKRILHAGSPRVTA